MRVGAVVVTFNRSEMMLETLRGLMRQTAPIDKIFVIDNASTDGTEDSFRSSVFALSEKISYIRLSQNTGGAGGFRYGIREAYEHGCDWIWTMDDDVEPDQDALEVLLRHTFLSECLNSKKVFSCNGEVQNWEQYFDFATGRLIDLKNVSFVNGKDWCPVNVACFEGMLVSRGLLEKVGFPDENYFIYQDDTVFGIACSFHTNVIYVRDAILRKKIYGYGSASPLRSYYMIRNTFKLKRQVFSFGLVGAPTRFTNFLFFINLTRYTFLSFIELPSARNAFALLKGWYHGVCGK